jgi:hypothetical protein
MSKHFKKLTLQYSYLKIEEEEVEEVCSSVEGEMQLYVKEHFPEFYKKIFGEENGANPKPNPEEDRDKENNAQENIQQPPKSKDLKKIYRKIAERTHPDKIGDNSKSELFSKAAGAYSKNDLGSLLEIAGSLNIEIVELSRESILLLKNNIKILSRKIHNMKQTTAWAWYNSSSDEGKRVIIQNILNHKGIK